MILILFTLVTAGSSQVIRAHWKSLLGGAPAITFFANASLVPDEESSCGLVLASKVSTLKKTLEHLRVRHLYGRLAYLLSMSPDSGVDFTFQCMNGAAGVAAQERNLTGYGNHWLMASSSPGSKEIILPGFDGEQVALQLPMPSSLHNTCTERREKDARMALYSLRSFGNGSTCWDPVADATTQLFKPYPSRLSNRTLRVVSLGVADVAVGDLSRTTARDALVDFTTLILDDAVTFVYYRGTSQPGLWTVLKPFPASVWALTFSAMLLMVTLLFAFNVARGALRTLDGTTTCSRRVLTVAKSVIHSYLTQDKSSEEGPRPLLGCWYVVFLVLTTVYCGRLTAFYVATLEQPVSSLAELVARRPHAIVLVKNGSLPFEVVKQPTYESLWRRRLVRVVNARTPVDDLLLMVAQHKAAGWMAEAAFGGARIREARLAGLSVASTSMAVSRWCIGLSKGSPFLPLFNRKILQLWSHGLIEHYRKTYFHADPIPAPDPTRPLTLENCKASFWMWFLGLMVACAACILERTLAGRPTAQKRLPDVAPCRQRRRIAPKPHRHYNYTVHIRHHYHVSLQPPQTKIVRRSTGLACRKH
ncbi:hypothetical protein HPB50_009548 [Hyalomma asiaticum]|uniref:Uncharacterized protein n=1 Tax=Hyalomma asiaticum TaxID=266040 RepID=A0ACB7T9A9_HYAAI|nr:hypothetical protein HPB50_009548 [Hyalomma asiaticum]